MAENDSASAQRPQTYYVEIGGARIAYSETGDGSPVIYAHGLTQSRDANRRADMLEFSPVAATHRLISYDARGHGQSGPGDGAEDYTWPALADDLLALADHVSPDRTVSAIGV